jgi:phage/plasmid primase-like uncharacterized protein
MLERTKTTEAAKGRWREILPALGVPAKFLTGRNGPCPACGGRDRFCFTDRSKNGDYICRQCGAGHGLGLVMKVNGWAFRQAAKAIDDVIGNRPVTVHYGSAYERRAHEATKAFFATQPDLPTRPEPPKATRDAALWLRKYRPDRLEEWLDLAGSGVRWWLDSL